jgi:predicted acylesterase/phospholipase RssA
MEGVHMAGTKKMKIILLAALLVPFICSGCATTRHTIPKSLVDNAEVGGMADIRTIMGEKNTPLQKSLVAALKEGMDEYKAADGKTVYPILAISGGSANGAYGAGLLKGWSDSGTRPQFKVVTGVSTGAIIAPLVFMGKDYDPEVEKLYTTMTTKDVMSAKGPFQILFGNSMASNKPLSKQLDSFIDDDLLKKIAAEHKKGRRLFVGTTHLDAQRFVVWDMGAIAERGDTKLFGQVILASASIPVIFPPAFINVEADGKKYDEMHVDGGTITQVFTVYKLLEGEASIAKEMGIDPSMIKGVCYIIRNGYVGSGYMDTKNNLASISERAFDTIINSQGIGDTYRIYTYMQQRGNDYNLAFIPNDCRPEAKQMFDPAAMKVLFDRGYQDAVKGYKWRKEPPGLNEGR